MNLSGQSAIVTGGAKGYGVGIAASLRKRGARVWVTGRDQAALDRAVTELDVKAVQADVIHEDLVEVKTIDLYLKPVYAFEYHWQSKDRRAVAEFDGLTGEMRTDGKTLRQKIGTMLTRDVLFDVGVDAVDLLVPGGGIAIKVARAITSRKS